MTRHDWKCIKCITWKLGNWWKKTPLAFLVQVKFTYHHHSIGTHILPVVFNVPYNHRLNWSQGFLRLWSWDVISLAGTWWSLSAVLLEGSQCRAQCGPNLFRTKSLHDFVFTPQKLTVEPRNKIQVWKMTFLFFERGLLMKEIPNNHLGCIKLCNGINYLLPGLPDFWTINCILGRFQPLVFRVCVFTLQTWSQVGCLSVRSSVLSLQPVPLGAANRGSGIADGDGKNLMFFVPW